MDQPWIDNRKENELQSENMFAVELFPDKPGDDYGVLRAEEPNGNNETLQRKETIKEN